MIVDALLAQGAAVCALVRPSAGNDKLKKLERPGVTIARVDMTDQAGLTRACADSSCVISALQGLEEVILDAQSSLLDAAVAAGVAHFIPSDFSIDLTTLPAGLNRNLDLRRAFDERLDRASIAATSIFNGAFGELLTTRGMILDMAAHKVGYWENADQPMDFTTMKNTAEFTAAVALEGRAATRYLRCAGATVSARDLAMAAEKVLHNKFELVRMGSLDDLARAIEHERAARPGSSQEVFPRWQGMQYLHNMYSGYGTSSPLDNDRYPGIRWTTVTEMIAARPS
jgi:nucleoside-diphosphate-sugar epimerase